MHGLQVDHAGQLHESHADLEQNCLKCAIFPSSEIAFRFFRKNAEQVDGRAGAQNVYTRALAFLCSRSHLDHGGNVELLHQVFEGYGRLCADGGILCADDLFQPLR